MTARRAARLACGAALLALGATACSFQGLYNVSLPGAAATSGHVITVSAEFTNVLDLVPDSSVRIDGVTVGSVKSITLVRHGRQYLADVTMRIPASDAKDLPSNCEAVLSQTSLLGEKYIALQADPNETPVGQIHNGEHITDGNTSEDATVEQVFGALSALLNGGGVEQIQTIAQDLTQTLQGREGSVRDLLTQLDTLVGNLNSQRGNIIEALDGLASLSGELNNQRTVIATSLTDLGPGLQVLADQRGEIVSLLQALAKLGTIGTQVIQATEVNTTADLDALEPTLRELAAAGPDLPKSLELALDFPFPAEASAAIPGDYTKLDVLVDLQSFETLSNPALPSTGGLPLTTKGKAASTAAGAPAPTATSPLSGVTTKLGTVVNGVSGAVKGTTQGLSTLLNGML